MKRQLDKGPISRLLAQAGSAGAKLAPASAELAMRPRVRAQGASARAQSRLRAYPPSAPRDQVGRSGQAGQCRPRWQASRVIPGVA